MPLHINTKEYMTNVVIDRGLSNINIKNIDIRPGKVSIDSVGNKLEAASSTEFLSIFTSDGNITPNDVTLNKIAYSNGKKIIGSAQSTINDYTNLINGTIVERVVSQNTIISVGEFVYVLPDTNVTTYRINTAISGIALQAGSAGDVIKIVIPNQN